MSLPYSDYMRTLTQLAEMNRMYAALSKFFPSSGSFCSMVGSASPGEGKTLTAGGLAAYLAQVEDQPILGIDFNWYQPRLHECFDIEQNATVQELRDAQSDMSLVQPTGISQLDLLAAPLSDQAFTEESSHGNTLALDILQQAREAYERIIIDTSSILPMNRNMIDPVTLSLAADGMLLVVQTWNTPREKVKKAKMTVESSGGKVLGLVVNQCKNPMSNQ